MESSRCRACDAELRSGFTFCAACGQSVEALVLDLKPMAPRRQHAVVVSTTSPARRAGRVLGLIGALAWECQIGDG